MSDRMERIRELRKARGWDAYAPIGVRSRPASSHYRVRPIVYSPAIGRDERGRETYATGCRIVENVTGTRTAGLRLACENATAKVSRDATGYYVDNDYGEATHGAVLQLPSRNGTLLLVPAAADPWNPGMYLADFGNVRREDAPRDDWDRDATLRDAMRAADSLAERYAEDRRDGDARFRAESDIANAREEIADCRVRLRALAAELRTVNLPPALCAELRASVQRIRAESHRAWQTIREREGNYWSAVSY